MKNNKGILSFLRRSFWVLMAAMCIVFSSASKRLIEMKMAPYYTVYQALGKKIKDGCRDKRDSFKAFKLTDKKVADSTTPELLFLVSALSALVFWLSRNRYTAQTNPVILKHEAGDSLPLFLRIHRLQV